MIIFDKNFILCTASWFHNNLDFTIQQMLKNEKKGNKFESAVQNSEMQNEIEKLKIPNRSVNSDPKESRDLTANTRR